MKTQKDLWRADTAPVAPEPTGTLTDMLHGDVDLFALFAGSETDQPLMRADASQEAARPPSVF